MSEQPAGFKERQERRSGNGHSQPPTKIPDMLSLSAFMKTYMTPEYVVDGIVQRGRLYSLTSLTGHGKTAVAILFAMMVASGRPIGIIETFPGRVVFLAGENPDDVCQRIHAACETYGFDDPAALPIDVIPGPFPLNPDAVELLKMEINKSGPVVLIIVDTAAAYSPVVDENDNVQAGAFARNLRVLIGCEGRPAVLVPCHPVKNAARDNLLPRGGGAFVNEVDVNLTLWSSSLGDITSLHWHAKLRGTDFQPLDFELRKVELRELKDGHGRPIRSIVAAFQTPNQAECASQNTEADENTVLEHLRRHPGISIADIAINAGWMTDRVPPQPQKSKVHRLLGQLMRDKLVTQHRRKWVLTEAGRKELDREG